MKVEEPSSICVPAKIRQCWLRRRVGETEDKMKGRLLLDVVIGQCTELFAGENKALEKEMKVEET
jgi:hypothetical protein